MATVAGHVTEENARLKWEFVAQGLDLEQVWVPTPYDPELENRQLRELLRWVLAYRTWPSRAELEPRGFCFPPVEPDMDPDSDWERFERWMRGQPVNWRFSDLCGELPDPDGLDDERVAHELERLEARLAEHGVMLDLHEGVPARLAYAWLRTELAQAEFEFLGPDTICHLDGCDGYCPGCFQRPWCELGATPDWPEDAAAAGGVAVRLSGPGIAP